MCLFWLSFRNLACPGDYLLQCLHHLGFPTNCGKSVHERFWWNLFTYKHLAHSGFYSFCMDSKHWRMDCTICIYSTFLWLKMSDCWEMQQIYPLPFSYLKTKDLVPALHSVALQSELLFSKTHKNIHTFDQSTFKPSLIKLHTWFLPVNCTATALDLWYICTCTMLNAFLWC